MSLYRWLVSREYRKAAELRSVVLKHFRHQRDVLPAKNTEELGVALSGFDRAVGRAGATRPELRAAADQLETVANKWLQRYPNASFRDNAESFLSTFALVFAVKTFFLSPMQIPTGSAQPTYYGITSEDLRDRPDVKFPSGIGGWFSKMWNGEAWYELIAEEDCELAVNDWRSLKSTGGTMRFPLPGFDRNFPVPVRFADGRTKVYTVPWAPEEPKHLQLLDPVSYQPRKTRFLKGEPIIRCVTRSGDRIVVERVAYNFRQPKRGEYFVFQSSGVGDPGGVTPGTHYIKRMVGGPNERLRIGDDRHLYVNDRRIEATDPGFERVLGFDPARLAADSVYSGYVNGTRFGEAQAAALLPLRPQGVADDVWRSQSRNMALGMSGGVAKYFRDDQSVHTLRPHHYMGFGDNTMGSSDSRAWGEIPEPKIIGKSCWVMWPPGHWGFEAGPRKKATGT